MKNRYVKIENDSRYCANLYNYCRHVLNESQHIVTNFNDIAKWIKNNVAYMQIDDKIYTGWNFHIVGAKCNFENNKYSGYPIYIVIDSNLNGDIFAYVENRDMNKCSIVLHINNKNIYDVDLESKLNHEFTHIRTMYSQFFKNPLQYAKIKYDVSDCVYYINEKTKYYSLEPFLNCRSEKLFKQHFDSAQFCLYLMSVTEQQARLNQLYKYTTQIYNSETVPNKDALLKETSEITLLPDFIESFEIYDNCNNNCAFRKVLCLAFYLNENNCIQCSVLTKENMLDYFNIFTGLNHDFDEFLVFPLNMTISYMRKSLLKYEQDVLNTIDNAISDIFQKNVK